MNSTMPKGLAIIANLLLAEAIQVDTEHMGPRWFLTEELATGHTLYITEGEVSLFGPEGWEEGDDPQQVIYTHNPTDVITAVKHLRQIPTGPGEPPEDYDYRTANPS